MYSVYSLFQLDPAHFLSVSSPTLMNELEKTKIKLDLFSDQTMYEMMETGIRGGISGVMGKKMFELTINTLIPI